MAVSSIFKISSQVTHTSQNDLGLYTGNPKIEYSVALTSSDTTLVFSDLRTTGAGADTIRVNNNSISDQYGTPLTFTNVKTIVIKNTHATNYLTVGDASDSVALMGDDVLTVKAGKCIGTNSPYPVSGSAHTLTITPSATGTTYEILITGN